MLTVFSVSFLIMLLSFVYIVAFLYKALVPVFRYEIDDSNLENASPRKLVTIAMICLTALGISIVSGMSILLEMQK